MGIFFKKILIFLPIFVNSSVMDDGAQGSASVLGAGGEPSTWPPPERLGKPFCSKNYLELLRTTKKQRECQKRIIFNFKKNAIFFRPLVPPILVLPPPIKSIAGHAALHALLF